MRIKGCVLRFEMFEQSVSSRKFLDVPLHLVDISFDSARSERHIAARGISFERASEFETHSDCRDR
jgi:hypothetical protein